MSRFITLSFMSVVLVLIILGVYFLKDSYMILPIPSEKSLQTAPFADWKEYKAPKFDSMFPGFPQQATQNIKDPKTKELRHYNMYVAEKENGAIFMISLITFPDQKEAPEEIQKTVVNDLLASNPKNRLKSMQVGTYQGFKTLDFSVVNDEMTIDGTSFIDGKTLVLLSTLFPNGSYNRAEFDHFLQSFKLKKE